MNNLKRWTYLLEREKNKRELLIFFLIWLIGFINIVYIIPSITKNNRELYKYNWIFKKINENEQYWKISKWEIDIDDITKKISIWSENLLYKTDSLNYLYIEKYINSIIWKYGQEFSFWEKINFINSWLNNLEIPLVFTNYKDLNTVLQKFSSDWYLWKSCKIEKEWNIYKLDLNLNFFIN